MPNGGMPVPENIILQKSTAENKPPGFRLGLFMSLYGWR